MRFARFAHSGPSVHPHGRGDNARRVRLDIRDLGSPPRAWGQCIDDAVARPTRRFTPDEVDDNLTFGCDDAVARPTRRFTPTGVGTMANQRLSVGYAAVHPHGRGDNRSGNAQSAEIRGSPPRAWGQLRSGKTLMACRRFTPTGVGTMVWRVGRCGASARFTPTGVGTISTSDRPRATSAVHPHGRGDNAMEYERAIVQLGSPPRAWGQSIVNAGEDRNLRFTPTGVGTIQHTAFALVLQPVHPHGRGDNGRNA